MSRVLCIALNPALDIACNVATVQPTRKMRTSGDVFYPGGGGVNVARTICELGGLPELVYLAGGETGAALDRLLEPYAMRIHRIETGIVTRVSYTVHEEATGFEYRFVPPGERIDAAHLEPIVDLVRRGGHDYVVASGSLPPGLPTDAYVRLADACRIAGGRFILDTSGEALRRTLYEAHVFLVKPSLGELQRLTGVEGDEGATRTQAMQIVNRGAADHVAVSMGAEGAMLVNEAGVTRVPSCHVRVRSAVGAGDSFVGAMTHTLARGEPIADAFRWGVAAGASAVATPGTALCERGQVERLVSDLPARADAA